LAPRSRITASKEFKPEESVRISDEHLRVEHRAKVSMAELRQWECTLRVQFQAPTEANAPYAFAVECVGLFRVASSWPPEKDEWLVKTNAPAVLFSTAREFVRGLMCAGPFSAILLPTVNFSDADEELPSREKPSESIAPPSPTP